MRPFEIILLIADILAFGCLKIPGFQRKWRNWVVVSISICTILQILFEGPRWQMYPAYVLPMLFLLIRINKKRIIGIAVTAVSILLFILSVTLTNLLPVFSLPNPTGPYSIGTLTYHWKDENRQELFSENPDDHRELTVRLWYPCDSNGIIQKFPYIQESTATAHEIARMLHLPKFLFTHLKYVTSNSMKNPPAAKEEPAYPVLLYLSGVNGFCSANSFQIEELVSHGYIVAGLDQPGIAPVVLLNDGGRISGWSRDRLQPLIMQSIEPQTSPPGIHETPLPNGIIPYFSQDAGFVLDQLDLVNRSGTNQILAGKLDLEHVGIFGISLGGINTAEICLTDHRFKAALIMDVWMPENVVNSGLKQPVMFLTRDEADMRAEHWTEHDIALTADTMKAVYEKSADNRYYIQIRGMFHTNYTDLPLWSPGFSMIGMTGPIDYRRGFDIVNAYSLDFFNKELKFLPSTLLSESSHRYPEVTFNSLIAK